MSAALLAKLKPSILRDLNLFGLVDLGDVPAADTPAGRRSLGGFHLMSGYRPGQLSGNQLDRKSVV